MKPIYSRGIPESRAHGQPPNWLLRRDRGTDVEYHGTMMNQENYMNPYAQYVTEKGYTLRECNRPSKSSINREVPAQFKDRFATYEEYQEAIHEFLNGL